MPDVRRVPDVFTPAPQISVADGAEAAAAGFATIICNRPDGEDPGQPSAATIAAAAHEAGLAYVHIPFSGPPGPAEVEAMRQAVDASDGPVLAYCRSGTRSITCWSIRQALSGAFD